MQNLSIDVLSYLSKHLIKNYEIEWQRKNGINNVIVIPAIAEYDNIKVLLKSLSKNDPAFFPLSLILFVINNSPVSSNEIKEDNLNSINLLRSIIGADNNSDFSREIINSGLQIGLIDASSEGKELNTKQAGVGLARKIGMDLSLTIFDYSKGTKKMIICLDADCTISQTYLTNIINDFNKNNYSVAVVNFEHPVDGTDEYNAAIICYEIFLRYYVTGLIFAGSDYAFHTIGSTMMCYHNAYMKIGGMNKRKAAEDFYFLEKLAKNYPINKIDCAIVYPSKRSSWRVPFGTGQRVTRFLSKIRDEYLLFDPDVFGILKEWLEIYNSDAISDPQDVLNQAKEIHTELYNFLLQNNYLKQWEKILSNTKSGKQLSHQRKIWFDGFKTLKLIHHLRDTAFPEINMFDALNMLFIKLGINNSIIRNGKEVPELDVQKEYLNLLRNFS
ncbi:MAG: glycosyltransferase [Bacteroidetes bacterium]|nr:glycosyltransferase [Bacteroidota bacterium]